MRNAGLLSSLQFLLLLVGRFFSRPRPKMALLPLALQPLGPLAALGLLALMPVAWKKFTASRHKGDGS